MKFLAPYAYGITLVKAITKQIPVARRIIPIEEEAIPKAAKYVFAVMHSNFPLLSGNAHLGFIDFNLSEYLGIDKHVSWVEDHSDDWPNTVPTYHPHPFAESEVLINHRGTH